MQPKNFSARRKQQVRNYFAHRTSGRWVDVASNFDIVEVQKHVRTAPVKIAVTVETKVTRAKRMPDPNQMRLPGFDEPAIEAPPRPKLSRPPGSLLLAFGEFAFSKKDFERVLLPTIADMRNEYFEALSEGREQKAQWVVLRGTTAFTLAAVAQVATFIMRLVIFWKAAS